VSFAQCSCGFTEGADDDETIGDHLFRAFAPEDDKGPDGMIHVEGKPDLTCLCGIAASTAQELDSHFLAVFTPDDSIGPDGNRHERLTA
jgi:hypothetical protein